MKKTKKPEKWIIVSNRLPVDYNKKTGKFSQASGGLVSALANLKLDGEKKWVGYAEDPESLSSYDELVPVPIERELYHDYYNGMSNDVIWPLCHYETTMIDFHWKSWEAYKKVNKLFAEKIASIASPNDVIWIHDYHLFLLPMYLRKKRPGLQIGFFLHIPFPSSEVFRSLSVRNEIIEGVLHSNLIGFQDFDFLRHFSSTVHTLLGIESDLMSIENEKFRVQLGVFPVSIDIKKFLRKKQSKVVANWKNQYTMAGKKIILGVDRLDYIKGIDLKLQAFRELLIQHPESRGKLHLIQVAVPSRVHVEEYIYTKNEVERLVGQINGEFGFPGYAPIHYIFSSVSFEQLLALYDVADILYVSSKRDGMNLVSMEYIAAQSEKNPGVVVLSEFTGAASILSHCIRVNPWNITETAKTLYRALNLTVEERKRRNSYMVDYLKNYDSTMWAKTFLQKLISTKKTIEIKKSELIKVTSSGRVVVPRKINSILLEKKIILFLDYDGTLTPIVDSPANAQIDEKTILLLKKLSKKKSIHGLVVVTGRDSKFIYNQLKDLDISIASEHGAKFYDRRLKKWISIATPGKPSWFPEIKSIMEDYTRRVPGSIFEKKEHALSWHYRSSPAPFGVYQARKLHAELETILANQSASLIWGKKVIEARTLEANKGQFVRWYISSYERTGRADNNHIFALGDDRTDEELFEAIQDTGTAIHIGTPDTIAPYYLKSQKHVFSFLENLEKNIL